MEEERGGEERGGEGRRGEEERGGEGRGGEEEQERGGGSVKNLKPASQRSQDKFLKMSKYINYQRYKS